ncbi:dTMP kinase [Campylobacter coli]
MEDGRFIVFEGIDGAGKDTLMNNFINYLNNSKRDDFKVVDWNNYPNYKEIKSILSNFSNKEDIKPIISSLATADMIHMSKDINSFLQDDYIVLCCRWYFSTFVYNGENDLLEKMINNKSILMPRLLVYVDTPVEECVKRILKRNNTLDSFEKEEVLKEIDKSYKNKLSVLKKQNRIDILTINGLDKSEICLNKLIEYTMENNFI